MSGINRQRNCGIHTIEIYYPQFYLKRVQMSGINRQRNCGIHTIEIYYPQFYLKQIEMEEYDARPDRYGPSVIGKYTKGIGQIEARYPTDDEECQLLVLRIMCAMWMMER